MSKNNLKIKFTYRDTTVALEWKGHQYSKESVEDFLNAFVAMLEMDLQVTDKEPCRKILDQNKEIEWIKHHRP